VKLIDRILRIATGPDDVVLDSFAGSGTTAHAVLNLNKEDGGNRKFILVELEDYADSITAERVKRVIDGYGSNGKEVEGTGSGFTYYELGESLFHPDGSVNKDVPIKKLREYIYFTETKKELPDNETDNPYFIGSDDGNSYYLLHEHEKPMSLDYDFLSILVKKDEAYIIYADRCLIDEEFMRKHNIIFKKVPRDIVRF
jgi:adenine-specific DNA-methyltransferase